MNKSLDFLRKKKRKKRIVQITSLFGVGEEWGEISIPSQQNPHGNLENKERRQILDAALDRLPQNQKTAIVLSKLQGFNNKEIAGIMDLSVSAVEALMHRAKKICKSYYTIIMKKIYRRRKFPNQTIVQKIEDRKMNKKEQIEKQVRETLDLLNNPEQLSPNPYFYTRVQARLEENSQQKHAVSAILRPALLTVLILLNLSSAAWYLKGTSQASQTDSHQELVDLLTNDFQLDNNETNLLNFE